MNDHSFANDIVSYTVAVTPPKRASMMPNSFKTQPRKSNQQSNILSVKTPERSRNPSGMFDRQLKQVEQSVVVVEPVPEVSDLDKYFSKVQADTDAYVRSAKRKQLESNDYFSMDYEKFTQHYKRDQLRLQAKASGMVVLNWYNNESEVSSDDLDDMIESFRQEEHFLDEVDPGKMNTEQLVRHIRQQVREYQSQTPSNQDNQILLKTEPSVDSLQTFAKMKLSDLLNLYNEKKRDVEALDLEFYRLQVEMSMQGTNYSELKEQMLKDTNLTKLTDFTKMGQRDTEPLLVHARKLRTQIDEIHQQLTSIRPNERAVANEESTTQSFKLGLEQQIERQRDLKQLLQEGDHTAKLSEIQGDLNDLHDQIREVQDYLKSSEKLKEALKSYVQQTLVESDIVLARMAMVKIKILRQTQLLENGELQRVVKANESVINDLKQKIYAMTQENRQSTNQYKTIKDLQASINEMSGIRERLSKAYQIRKRELDDRLSKAARERTQTKGKRLSIQNLVNIKGLIGQPNIQRNEDEVMMEQTLLAKKKTSELILKVREANLDRQQEEDLVKHQLKLIQCYKDFRRMKG